MKKIVLLGYMAAQKAAAAAAAASSSSSSNEKTSKLSKNGKKSKQANSQYVSLNANNPTITTAANILSASQNSGKDSGSINSEDSCEPAVGMMNGGSVTASDSISTTMIPNSNGTNLNVAVGAGGSITARSISSITGSLSLDLLDQLKLSNAGSDVDSEGYSIRPDSSIRIKKNPRNPLKNNDDMNNLYASSSTVSESDDSDSECGDGFGGPVKVMLKIKPKSEVSDDKQQNNAEVLREISKNLQLKPPGQQQNNQVQTSQKQAKKKTYCYSYGTSTSGEQADSPTPPPPSNSNMHRSVSVGSGVNSTSLLDDLSFDLAKPALTTSHNNNESLLDLTSNPPSKTQVKIADTNLYNIDEDREVESSFQYGNSNNLNKRRNNLNNASPSNNTNNNAQQQLNNGRFTPACFPGRTTPDFRYTTSLFEQQGTRASIVSPLTLSGHAAEITPIAISFNETIHAYFKLNEPDKFKVKCFGCMKISFPYAVLRLLVANDLPLLDFQLGNLQIANQDLKINNQLLTSLNQTSSDFDNLQFHFVMANLSKELKLQHQQNKQAAFFNFELLKYEFKYSSTPLILSASWSSDDADSTVTLNVDYEFNFRKSLSQVNFMVVVPFLPQSQVGLVKSEPNALLQEADSKLQVLWQVGSLNSNGRLHAKFNVTNASNAQITRSFLDQFHQPVYVKFHVDNETLSQVKFDILSPNYKLSLMKERIETGKYFCNNEPSQQLQQQQQQPPPIPPPLPTNQQILRKPPFAGSLSTSIGSTVDILLNH